MGAAYIDFGSGNVVVALAIATIKASFGGAVFHAPAGDKPVNGIIAMAGFLFLGIFLMFCFIDQDSRTDPHPLLAPAPVLNLPPGKHYVGSGSTCSGPARTRN